MKQTDTAQTDTPPQKAKKSRTVGREIKEIYRLNAENETDAPEFLSAVPIHANERRYIKQNYGAGLYLIEEKQGGRFKGRYEVSIEDFTEPQTTALIAEALPEPEDFDAPEDFPFEPDQDVLKLHFENRSLRKDMEILMNEIRAIKAGNQSDKQAELTALERAHAQTVEILMMTLANAQKPQQDATLQAMGMLEKSFGIVTKARAISDEISPIDTGGGGSSTMLGDAAKIIESVGKHAPTFIPMLGGLLGGGMSKTPARQTRAQNAPTTNGDGQNSGIADLAKKVKDKETTNK